jgi:hypothetical protein
MLKNFQGGRRGNFQDILICCIFNYFMFVSNYMASYVRLHVAILLIQYAEAGDEGRIVWSGTWQASIIVQMLDGSLYIEQRYKNKAATHLRLKSLRNK